MNIDSVKNGIVIDHIQAKRALDIYDALKLGELDCSVAIITNAKSYKMGRKDIIKIDKDIKLAEKVARAFYVSDADAAVQLVNFELTRRQA